MLSIVICSINKERLRQLCENIRAMSTCDNEIIAFYNEENLGLCAVYNHCAQKAKYELLCFVHDDLRIMTKGWDKSVATQLQKESTGFIGVMGGSYKSAFGVSWNDGPIDLHHYNVVNGITGKHLLNNPSNSNSEVVCIDGAFLCCTKDVWIKHKFDEDRLKGFHFYDLDVCLQTKMSGLKNRVIYNLVIEHLSPGNKDAVFLENYFLFRDKWKNKLPMSVKTFTAKQIKNFEGYALSETILLLKKNGLPIQKSISLIWKYFTRYKNIYHLLRSFYFLIFRK